MIGSADTDGTAEEICNLVMNGEEPLDLPGRPEALHDTLSPPRWLEQWRF
jgi:hypothetical protein